MDKLIIGIVVVGIVWGIFAAYYFVTHCVGIPVLEMPSECALLIYTSK
jgi:hypothetical protein